MRIVSSERIRKAVADICIKACLHLRPDVLSALVAARKKERNQKVREILTAIVENASLASAQRLAICQDTGMPVVFAWVGQDIHIRGDFQKAITKGVEDGYQKGYLRNSIIKDPLQRGTSGYSPAVIHTELVLGKHLRLTVLPKGFGCENKSQLKMFAPTVDMQEIKKFIIEAVKAAGPDACPPYVVGVGIGGTADYACLLAKKALLRPIKRHLRPATHDTRRKLESELRSSINSLNIGPMGLGGKATCLAVHIETYPTHIAGLPVAVNLSCHALRSATAVI
ncbi:MAG TPA: fumarate hydratase [Candidatus Omnitrophota bacterium]|nr:fumarate hydratase [Candidatus Omnitrophota bacterium]HPT07321.1 fumarate hydratase [Candidatus Omnitrophota bacterium]